MRTDFKGIAQIVITGVALFAVAYHLLYTQLMILNPIEHQNLHYMFALALVYLCSVRDAVSVPRRLAALVLLGLALYATGYIFVHYTELEQIRGPILALNRQDMIVGCLMVGLGLEASRRSFGPVFPIVAGLFILYAFFGWKLPGVLQAPKLDNIDIIASYVMALNGGMFGSVLGISANYIFLFIVFGGVLGVTGAAEFFNQIGVYAGRKMAGGPAISSVVSSAFMGSVTGSVMANVATTGAFTIPLMKKVGYKPHQAGAIEAAASSGGQIMPPVMGATAFIMAEMAETPYVTVMLAALLPALLYFFSVGIYAQLQAKKLHVNSVALDTGLGFKKFMMDAPLFTFPLIIITILLIMGYTPMFTIFWALIALLALNFWHVWMHKDWAALKKLIPAFTSGATTAAKIAVTCAVLGPIITTMTKTVLGLKIPSIIAAWCGGSLLAALALTALVCIVLGMGLPTMAAYLLVAMVGVPTLIQMGVPMFSAHMFVFVFAVFSCLTPPIAVAAIPAAGLAGSGYMRTAFEASKVGCVGFLIPFIAVFIPDFMLGQGDGGYPMMFFYLGLAIALVIFYAMAIVGYGRRNLDMWERLIAGGAALGVLYFMFSDEPLAAGLAVLLGTAFIATQFRKKDPSVEENPVIV